MNRLALALSLMLAAALCAEEPRRDRFGDPLTPGAVARLGTVNAHPWALEISYSADGRTLLTHSIVVVRHWDPETGRVRRVRHHPMDYYTGHQAIAADGRTAALVVGDRLEVRDLEHDKVLHRFDIPRLKELLKPNFGLGRPPVAMLALAPRGDLVFFRLESANHTLLLRDGKIESWPELEGEFAEPVFSTNGKYVAFRTVGENGEVAFRDTAATTPLTRFRHYGPVHAIAPDGSLLAIRNEKPEKDGRKVRLVESRTGRVVAEIPVKSDVRTEFPLSDDSRAGCFSHDGRLLAVATHKEIFLWDVPAKRLLWRLPGTATSLAFSPDASRLAGVEHVVRLWDVKAGKAIGTDFGPLPSYFQAHAARGSRIIMQHPWLHQVQVWDWTTGRPCFIAPLSGQYGDTTTWLSADGARLHLAERHKLRTWEIDAGKLLRELDAQPADLPRDKWKLVESPVPSADGTELCALFAEGSNEDVRTHCVYVRWDMATGKPRERREWHLPPFRYAAICRDSWGIWHHGGQLSTFRAFDVRNGRERENISFTTPDGRESDGFNAELPDSRLRLFEIGGEPPELFVVDGVSRKAVLRVPIAMIHMKQGISYREHGPTALSSDGRWLVHARPSGIELWDLIEQKRVPFHPPHVTYDTFERGPSQCDQIEFVSNDRLLAQYPDMTALVWELPEAARRPPNVRMSATTWDDLASDEPLVALRAAWALKNDPKTGLELLRRLNRVESADEKQFAALFADLGSNNFAARESATRRLRALGRTAETFLTAALAKPTTAEQRRRGRQLLDELQPYRPTTADERRAIRAVYAAELIGDASRALLTDWAKGDAAAALTREAKAALERRP